MAKIRLEQQWGFGSIHVLNAHENGYENRIHDNVPPRLPSRSPSSHHLPMLVFVRPSIRLMSAAIIPPGVPSSGGTSWNKVLIRSIEWPKPGPSSTPTG